LHVAPISTKDFTFRIIIFKLIIDRIRFGLHRSKLKSCKILKVEQT